MSQSLSPSTSTRASINSFSAPGKNPAIDFSKVSGEYCFYSGSDKNSGWDKHHTHYAIDPTKTQEDLIDFEGLTPQMILALAKDEVFDLETFASCADWELAGGYTVVDGKRVKDDGILEPFDMALEEAQFLVMKARIELGMVDAEAILAEAEAAATAEAEAEAAAEAGNQGEEISEEATTA